MKNRKLGAVAWVLAQRPFLHPIAGTTSISHLEENLGASEITLTDVQVNRLAASFAVVAGDRYPPAAMKRVQL